METKSLYVLDTSVFIHDPGALRSFRDTAVAIPIFVVMELDDLKGSARHEVASAARTASRSISSLMEHGSLRNPEGVVDPGTGTRVYVVGSCGGVPTLKEPSSRKMDHLILDTSLSVQKRFQDLQVVLVTKDVNLRILADAEGLSAQDYNTDRVAPDEIPTGYRVVEVGSEEEFAPLQEALYENKNLETYRFGSQGFRTCDLVPNEFLVARVGPEGPGTEQYLFRWKNGKFRHVQQGWRGLPIKARNLEQRMALDLLMDPDVHLVTLLGPAGTGKTLTALAAAVHQMDTDYERIILSKAVVPMGRDLGFLPGSEAEKMHPWVLSYYDNLDQIFKQDKDVKGRKGSPEKTYDQLIHSGKIEIQTLHSVRGRSIGAAYFIVDEVQNLSPHEIRTVVSRAATGTKMVLCGDPSQIDDAYLDALTNGLVHTATASRGSPIAGTVTLKESVRSPLAELAAKHL